MGAGDFPGQPLALPRRRGEPGIIRQGKLERDLRATVAPLPQVAGEAGGAGRIVAFNHFDPGGANPGRAGTCGAGIGIVAADHHPGHPARGNQSGAIRAARRWMGTGFEGDIERRAARCVARRGQGYGFGMGASAGLGPAAANHPVVLDQNRADCGIGPR